MQISTARRLTCAVTAPKGKVYFVGDKFAQNLEIDNSKFGFHELPVDETDLFVEPPKREVVEEAELEP